MPLQHATFVLLGLFIALLRDEGSVMAGAVPPVAPSPAPAALPIAPSPSIAPDDLWPRWRPRAKSRNNSSLAHLPVGAAARRGRGASASLAARAAAAAAPSRAAPRRPARARARERGVGGEARAAANRRRHAASKRLLLPLTPPPPPPTHKVYVFPAHSIIRSIISLTRSKREELTAAWKASALRDGRRRMFPSLGNATGTISKNISLVLDNLLKNYESSQLPSHGKGHPTVVRTNMLIRSMGPFSELDMDYSMDCYFRQSWRDSRLSFSGPIKNLSLSIKMLERIWRPDTYFYNGKNSYVHTITVPNKLLRITQDGDILYSMRLTIKAKCTMELRKFPMDSQSCPLMFGSYAYTSQELVYQWTEGKSVDFVQGLALSQFDLMGSPKRNITFKRREGEFSVLQVNFNLQRHTGYFLIQVYVPCILIVVLSWVSFWIHREATSDRVGLGITTVLTLSTISLDSRTDLPKVRYATALDWFLLMSFFYCIATLLEFAAVHYFTKVGSGEIPPAEDEFEESEGPIEEELMDSNSSPSTRGARRRSSLICPIYNDPISYGISRSSSPARPAPSVVSHAHTRVTRHTQTERHVPKCRQLMYCLIGDDGYRRQRQREAAQSGKSNRYVNSVSHIDRGARIFFPASFGLLNVLYWLAYYKYQEDFRWKEPPSLK